MRLHCIVERLLASSQRLPRVNNDRGLTGVMVALCGGARRHRTVSDACMVGWKVQTYDSVPALRATYVHELPGAMLRESKSPCEVAVWGTRSLLRQTLSHRSRPRGDLMIDVGAIEFSTFEPFEVRQVVVAALLRSISLGSAKGDPRERRRNSQPSAATVRQPFRHRSCPSTSAGASHGLDARQTPGGKSAGKRWLP